MIFLIIFIILIVSYAIAFTSVYFKLNNSMDKITNIILDLFTTDADCKTSNKIHFILLHIKTKITNNLIIIFIIQIIIYCLFIFILKKHDLDEQKLPIYIMFFLKIIFCAFILFYNSINKETNDLNNLKKLIPPNNQNKLNDKLQIYINDIETINNQIFIDYNIVYSIEIIFNIIFMGLLYKYDEVLELLDLD